MRKEKACNEKDRMKKKKDTKNRNKLWLKDWKLIKRKE